MQKHERECVELAKELLEPAGFCITEFRSGRLSKLRILAEKGSVRATKTVSSSPRSDKADQSKVKSWAKKLLAV